MEHFATPTFWHLYRQLPADVRTLADKNFALLKQNPSHPSLHLKKAGISAEPSGCRAIEAFVLHTLAKSFVPTFRKGTLARRRTMNPELVDWWPLCIACSTMVVAGVLNLRTLAVPNSLSLGLLMAGWTYAAAGHLELVQCEGGLIASIGCAMLAGGLLLPFYRSGVLGAGCVKMQAAFGAWVGAAMSGLLPWTASLVATLAGAALTAVVAFGIYDAKCTATRHALPDVGDFAPPRAPLFAAQATLSLGSIVGFICVLCFYCHLNIGVSHAAPARTTMNVVGRCDSVSSKSEWHSPWRPFHQLPVHAPIRFLPIATGSC